MAADELYWKVTGDLISVKSKNLKEDWSAEIVAPTVPNGAIDNWCVISEGEATHFKALDDAISFAERLYDDYTYRLPPSGPQYVQAKMFDPGIGPVELNKDKIRDVLGARLGWEE